jgi:hypothetical protein
MQHRMTIRADRFQIGNRIYILFVTVSSQRLRMMDVNEAMPDRSIGGFEIEITDDTPPTVCL